MVEYKHSDLAPTMYDDYDLEYAFGNDNILDEDMYYEYNHQQDDMMISTRIMIVIHKTKHLHIIIM